MRLVFDIETNGLLDTLDKIHCIVIKDIDNDMLYFSSSKHKSFNNILSVLENADEIIGHNIIGFDLPAIQKVYPNFSPKGKVTDTLVISRLIEADLVNTDFDTSVSLPKKLYGSHSLKAWGLRLGNHKGDYDGGWEEFSEEMLEYCKQDVEVTHALWKRLAPEKYSQQAIKFEHQVAELCDRIGNAGWTFDITKASHLYAKLAQERATLEGELQTLFEPWEIVTEFIPKVNNKKLGYKKGEPFNKVKVVEFNPNSRKHIQFCLEKKYRWKPKKMTPSGDAQIDETILAALPYPEAKKLARMFMLNKRIGMLAEGNAAWLKLVKDNGQLHHSIISNGAVTGRATHRYPNLAQVPAVRAEFGKECRELFTVPTGYELVGSDLSGIELRSLAYYLSAYDKGAYAKEILNGDIHTKNQNDAGLETRDQAKTFIFALIYGGGDLMIGKIAGSNAKKGKELKDNFYKANPSFKQLKDNLEQASNKGYILGLDKRKLKIRSRHKSFNTLLQSCAALICKQWILNIDHEIRRQNLDAKIIAWVHDEVQIAVKKGDADHVGDITSRMAKKTGEDFNITEIPIEAEFKIGTNWANTH
tara:strand:+ start:33693 stop:35453 length:1761 start_codon:yes stop_codon:yes gene_type:complete